MIFFDARSQALPIGLGWKGKWIPAQFFMKISAEGLTQAIFWLSNTLLYSALHTKDLLLNPG